MGPFDYHVFAHKAGRYQTAEASPTISASEKAMLEQYFFGQTNDAGYLSSLATTPGIMWRRIGDRFALTRVLSGERDPDGRATLRFETLLIAPADADRVAGAVAGVALAKWNRYGQQFVVAGSAKTAPGDLHPDIVSQAALAFQSSGRAVLPSDGVSLTDVQAIIKRFFRDPGFSLCYRCLNDKAPVAINFAWGSATRTAPTLRQSEAPMPKLPAAPTKPSAAFSTGAALASAVLLLLLVVQLGLSFHLRGLVAELKNAQGNTQQAVLDRIEAKSQTVVGELHADRDQLLGAHRDDSARLSEKVDTNTAQLLAKVEQGSTQLAQKLDITNAGVGDAATRIQQVKEYEEKNLLPVIQAVQSAADEIKRQIDKIKPQPEHDKAGQAAGEGASSPTPKEGGIMINAIRGALDDLEGIRTEIGRKGIEELRTRLDTLKRKLRDALPLKDRPA
jgi:cell division septum initiation protein DivIVA